MWRRLNAFIGVVMHIDDHIEQMQRIHHLGFSVCLVLTRSDFIRGRDPALDQLRCTYEDVMVADRVIVVDCSPLPDAPVNIVVLKERVGDTRDYMYIARPFDLTYS